MFIRYNNTSKLYEYADDPTDPSTTWTDLELDAAQLSQGLIPAGRFNVWTSVSHGSITFSASGSMTWTVASGDLSYYKYLVIGKLVFIKGAIVTSTTGGTASNELRISAPSGVTFAGNDSFGFGVWTEDGFTNQDVGQAIARVSGNYISLKKRDGSNWALATDLVAYIFNMVAEIS